MKKSVLLITVFILAACSSTPQQETVTPEVTVTSSPPPTETPIPTPTFHPQFTALQNEIVDSSTRFTLQADGLIYDGETPIHGITVAPDGRMSLNVNGETVTLDPGTVSFGEEGIEVDGYELNDDGEWVEAISKSMQQTNRLIETYNLADAIEAGEITVTEERGAVNVTDNETGRILIRVIGETSKYDLEFAVKTVTAHSCQKTDIIPGANGGVSPTSIVSLNSHRDSLLPETSFKRAVGQMVYPILVDGKKQCWAFTNGQDLAFRDESGVAWNLDLFEATEDKILELFYER